LIETNQAIPEEIPRDYKVLIERAKQLIESAEIVNVVVASTVKSYSGLCS
jgi:hypothetical protein